MKRANISSRGNCDFLSGLPDPILNHILGLLKAKEAVQTCVLSKRWQHLWTDLPSLDFTFDLVQRQILTESEDDDDDNDDDDDDNDDYDDYLFREKAASRWFKKFVNTLLLRRKPLDLDMFFLSSHKFLGLETECIHYAVNHNTRILHLSIVGSVPSCIFTCTSLEELYLHQVSLKASFQIVNLPNLRKLSIYSMFLYSNHVKNLLSGCTILEFLRLDRCFLIDCVIAHKSLKHLAIVDCYFNKTQLVISAPNLLSFVYDESFPPPSNTTLNMPSLASSCLMTRDYSMMKCLVRMTTNVELLELHFKRHLLEESVVVPLELPIFSNLKNLTVVLVTFSCFQTVNCVLKSSPNLEKLTLLQEGCLSLGEEGASTNESTNVSSTIALFPYKKLKKLKIVVVKYWKYNQMIGQLVDTLMDAIKEFENLKIHLSKYKSSRQKRKNSGVFNLEPLCILRNCYLT